MDTASELTTLQICPRKLLIERERGEEKLWRPARLYEHCLKKAVLNLSAGMSLANSILEATTTFAEACARPGLLTSHQPYTIAQDWIAMLKTSITAIEPSWMVGQGFIPGPTITLPPWKCASMQRCTDGTLVRWVTLPKFTKELSYAELQSWYTIGDICATGLPMVVNFIEVGAARKGHQHSAWCRTFAHPAIRGRYAFQQRDGKPLEGNWKAVWFQDSSQNDAGEWVQMMERDCVKLIHSVNVKPPSVAQREAFKRTLWTEIERSKNLEPLEKLPIYRPACNGPHGPCQWQYLCLT